MPLPFLLLLVVATCAAASPAEQPLALLVGASQGPGGHLPSAETDVRDMRKALRDAFQIRDAEVLTGRAATRERVRRGFRSLTRRASAHTPVVVYVSAAGALVPDTHRDEPDPFDEALVLADGLLLDDELQQLLQPLAATGAAVTLVLDVGLEGPGDRFGGRRPAPHASARAGDGAARWPTVDGVTVIEAAVRGPAQTVDGRGWLTEHLVSAAPSAHTVRQLEQTLLARVPRRGGQIPDVAGLLDGPVFGVPRVTLAPLPPAPRTPTRAPLTVYVPPEHAEVPWVDTLRRHGQGWLELVDGRAPGAFQVAPDPVSETGELLVVGPRGASRNRGNEISILRALQGHARQQAVRAVGLPAGPLRVRLVPAAEQESCSPPERWQQSGDGELQIVPACHRWEIEVTLAEGDAPRAVGGLILGNDGRMLGFPSDARPVTLVPGETHRFGVLPDGVKAVPPFGIPEHVVVFAGPVGAGPSFEGLARGASTGFGEGWTRNDLAYVIEANAITDARDPETFKEVSVDYRIGHLMPQNTHSLLYGMLENVARLARYRGHDGLDYAQCIPEGSGLTTNNDTRYPASRWPGGSCWSQPFDFGRDRAELLESPGIDCSTTVWWLFTRTCTGDVFAELPERAKGERNAAYQARLWAFHTETRGCLLVSDERYRGGFLSTKAMLDEKLMSPHWEACSTEDLRPGDVLVSRNATNKSGHTYVVIDPERFVVFGSHASDIDPDAEDLPLIDDERISRDGSDDPGVEYQLLSSRHKEGGERFAGFDTQKVKRCWRHRTLAAEWDAHRSNQAGTARLDDRFCAANRCEPPGAE